MFIRRLHTAIDALLDACRSLYAFWQRGRRGWADCDTWNMDLYLAEVIGPMLRHLAATEYGCPPGFGTSATPEQMDLVDVGGDHEAWRAYLRIVAEGYDAYCAIHEGRDRYCTTSYEQALATMKKLFEYYPYLWN